MSSCSQGKNDDAYLVRGKTTDFIYNYLKHFLFISLLCLLFVIDLAVNI